MQKTQLRKLLSMILCLVLIAAMALCATGCDNQETPAPGGSDAGKADPIVLGEGETVFTFTVVDGKGDESVFEIHTDKTIVGEALQELELISGEEGPYGLYVKVVNGITADYDVNGTYWAFYIDGSYATSGIDVTDITPGASYAMKVEK